MASGAATNAKARGAHFHPTLEVLPEAGSSWAKTPFSPGDSSTGEAARLDLAVLCSLSWASPHTTSAGWQGLWAQAWWGVRPARRKCPPGANHTPALSVPGQWAAPSPPTRRTHLVQVLQSGWQVVADHLHGFEGWLVEVGGLPIHHLDHHHPQRPDIHL